MDYKYGIWMTAWFAVGIGWGALSPSARYALASRHRKTAITLQAVDIALGVAREIRSGGFDDPKVRGQYLKKWSTSPASTRSFHVLWMLSALIAQIANEDLIDDELAWAHIREQIEAVISTDLAKKG